MARFPGARWRPVSGHTDGPMRSHLGVVLHVNQSNGNLYNWVAGNNGMSCHFEVYKDGSIEQYIDTEFTAWCQMDGNADYLSIETEGYDTEPLTDPQCATIANLLFWLRDVHRIPLQLAEQPGEAGFGWHGMGGAAWGGHTGCPGTWRRAQRSHILALINTTPSTEDDDMRIVHYPANKKFPLLLGTGPKPQVLRRPERAHALAAAGVLQKDLTATDYDVLRSWADS